MRRQWKPLYNVSPRDIRVRTRGYLPHWEIPGATYSITFRLADSLPSEIAERLRQEYHSAIYQLEQIREPTAIERSELAQQHALRVDHYLDQGHGACILREPDSAGIVRDAILFFDKSRYDISAWCIMPNHVHIVMRPFDGWSLSKLMHSLKSFTSKEINKVRDTHGRNWQDEYYDRIIRNPRDLDDTISYVRSNPSKAGLRNWKWTWP